MLNTLLVTAVILLTFTDMLIIALLVVVALRWQNLGRWMKFIKSQIIDDAMYYG